MCTDNKQSKKKEWGVSHLQHQQEKIPSKLHVLQQCKEQHQHLRIVK